MLDDILNDTGKLIFVIVAFGIIFDLVMAFVLFNFSKKFVTNAEAVTAKISKLEPNGKYVTASLKFKDPFGKDIETSLRVSPTKNYKENDEIEILSGKDNPEKVKINSFISLWILPITLVQSAVMLAVVLGILVYTGQAKLPF